MGGSVGGSGRVVVPLLYVVEGEGGRERGGGRQLMYVE